MRSERYFVPLKFIDAVTVKAEHFKNFERGTYNREGYVFYS